MSLFSSIADALNIPESDSIGDDNSALSAEQNNPLMSAPILGMRTAYDAIHGGFSSVISSKNTAIKQLNRYIDNWIDVLNKIVDKYTELLNKINDIGADISGAVTIDFAKEAWEIIQDTPILRRYLGEANYWYMYDTLGLLATQTGSMSADILLGIKEVIRQTILAVIACTDGLISLESYLGYIQSAWGFLYVKCFWHVTLDSILPQVTTAYWYKPTHTSISNGNDHKFILNNNPPGKGFVPLPIPVPNPVMQTREASRILDFDYQNPDTWYLNGEPYYMPNTMELLHRAYSYWGSSYTDALHIPNMFYTRRPYRAEGLNSSHPLRVGKTLYQLDTNKKSICGSNKLSIGTPESSNDDFTLDKVFTENLVKSMEEWDSAYKQAYSIIYRFITQYYSNPSDIPTTISDWLSSHSSDFNSWKSTNDYLSFIDCIDRMTSAWASMVSTYSTDNEIYDESKGATALFDSVMKSLVNAGKSGIGGDYMLDSSHIFMVGLSYNPFYMNTVSDDENRRLGVPYIAYKIDTSKSAINYISYGHEATDMNDSVNVAYPVSKTRFVMFPSNITSPEDIFRRGIEFTYIPETLVATVTNVDTGLKIGDNVSSGNLIEFVAQYGMDTYVPNELGNLPEALCKHMSSGLDNPLTMDGISYNLGNIFFPDGIIAKEASAPVTFYDVYKSYIQQATDTSNEFADIVGYSIQNGREPKFPCFGVYGNLIKMSSWNYKEMPYSLFIDGYTQIKSSSKLYYDKDDPSHVILYHSSYFSQARQTTIAIYHEYVAHESKSYGPNDSYDYYVFPGESISVSKLPKSNFNMGMLLSIDATSPSGEDYHYTIIKNPIPHSPKYVDATEWSFMDITYELLLLAYNLSGLCGDNGKRLNQLEDDLKNFGITIPAFLGELPENNGQFVDFKFDIMETIASKVEKALNSVYEMRSKLVAATLAW